MNERRMIPLDVRLMNLCAAILFVGVAVAFVVGLVREVLRSPAGAVAGITIESGMAKVNALSLRANAVPRLSGNFVTMDLQSARASFEQVVTNPLTGSKLQSRGEFEQARPDRFAFRFADPKGDVIVSDGKFVWVYLPSSTPGQRLALVSPSSRSAPAGRACNTSAACAATASSSTPPSRCRSLQPQRRP